MDLSKSPIFGLMGRRMDWLTQRHSVLAQNIANSDTPGFAPSDLSKASFRDMVRGQSGDIAKLTTSSAGHIQPASMKDSYRVREARETYETALGGNAVVLEEQLMKVSETQGAYNLVTNLYKKHVDMLKMAIGRRNG